MKPIEVIGQLPVPNAVRSHRFYREALVNARLLHRKKLAGEREGGVVGTENTQRCELYGWAPNVDPHIDNTGFAYLMCLNPGWTALQARPDGGALERIELEPGTVVRMDDRVTHWTEDRAPRVAMFMGSFEAPCDSAAMEAMGEGLYQLAIGAYYDTPRVRDGFRILLADEVYATTTFDSIEIMLAADAKARDAIVETCAICGKPAVKVDPHWPYFGDRSRCRDHLTKDQ